MCHILLTAGHLPACEDVIVTNQQAGGRAGRPPTRIALMLANLVLSNAS